MPQVKRSLALIYAVNPFGADHQSSEHDPGYAPGATQVSLERLAAIGLTSPQEDRVMNREKAKLALYTQWNYSFMDTADLCQFVWGPSWQLGGTAEMAELMTAVTGWETTIAEVQRIGERRLNLMRAFNARAKAPAATGTLCPGACSTSRSKAASPTGSSSRARSSRLPWTTTTTWPAGTSLAACRPALSWRSWDWAGMSWRGSAVGLTADPARRSAG